MRLSEGHFHNIVKKETADLHLANLQFSGGKPGV
jgi:hypothetical protein